MLPQLTPEEARVIGCLMEKSIVTPDQYPMTLNGLTNACNQKSSREPVMSLKPGEVQRAARSLQDKHLVQIDENFRSGVEKYKQRLCNTTFSDFQFDSAQFAVITLLLLRGPQTPGELKTRSGRLHAFDDNDAVVETLSSLMHRGGEDPLVVKLPRTPGRKDSEYMHLLGGPVDTEAHARQQAAAPETGDSPPAAETAPRPAPARPAEPPARPKPAETRPPATGSAPTHPRPAAAPSPAGTIEAPARTGARPSAAPDTRATVARLVRKVENLEAEIAELKTQLKALL